jgi:hypothetical protein
MLIRCAESSVSIGCACNILIGHTQVLTVSSFWSILLFFSFHPLKSQGAHNEGFQGNFCPSYTV